MAEELTSSASTPEQAPTGQPGSASEPAPRPTTPAEPKAPTKETKSVNLQEFDEFKEWQRKTNETLNRERKQREQERAMAQQEIQRLRAEMEQLVTRDMSSEELTQRQVQQLQQQLQDTNAQYNQLYQTYSKELAMAEIARRAGVDPSLISDAENPDEAWEMALQSRLNAEKEEAERRYKEDLQSAPGNSPDLGGAKTQSSSRSWENVHWDSNKGMRDFYRELTDQFNES